MDNLASIINTILLIAIFWYQKSKNKVLADRITEQSNLLRETKDVVTQQAKAIESQKLVVDTALEYSKAFDLEKIESVIKREVTLDYKEQISAHESKIEEHQQSAEKFSEVLATGVKSMADDYIGPLSGELFSLLLQKPENEAREIISRLPTAINEVLSVQYEEALKTIKAMA
ncbi:hypothetical protein [Shewanella sp. 125m-1]